MFDELNLEDLKHRAKLNRDHQIDILNLQKKFLEKQVERLEILKRQYEEDKPLELKCLEDKMNDFVARAGYMTSEALRKKKKHVESKLKEFDSMMKVRFAEAESQSNAYKNLSPDLLAEYIKLRDDLECRELLIKIGQDNEDGNDLSINMRSTVNSPFVRK